LQKDADKTVSTTKQLALAYKNSIPSMDCMCNKYSVFKIRDESRPMFISFCDAPIADQESQREGCVEGLPAIGEGQDFNIAVIKEVVVDLYSAHTESV